MGGDIIRMGDKTSHGGTVISADMTWYIDGKPVARVGDMTVCPRCKDAFPIATGAGDLTSFGQAVARAGDQTACGATLIASQQNAFWLYHIPPHTTGKADDAGDPVGAEASLAVAREAPTICLECLAAAAATGTALIVRSGDA